MIHPPELVVVYVSEHVHVFFLVVALVHVHVCVHAGHELKRAGSA